MKILFITPNYIEKNEGGSLNVRKFYLSFKVLKNYLSDLDLYIVSPSDLEGNSIKLSKTRIYDVLARLFFHSNYTYINWWRIKNAVRKINPDIVFLTNSRLGFIAKKLKAYNRNLKIICQFDNIEYDYAQCYFGEDKNNLLKKVLKEYEKLLVYRDEACVTKYCDYLIFLTERDRRKCEELYKFKQKSFILPICLEHKAYDLKWRNLDMNFIFIGSLWYKPNYNGIKWFIDNVWFEIYNEYKGRVSLIIGGKNPPKDLMQYNGVCDISIYANFDNIEDIVPKNSVFISPLFEGSGMKVKVAEALCMGLPIIATDESLIGYDEALNHKDCFVIRANTKIEFVLAIKKFINEISNKPEMFDKIRETNTKIFNKYYSIERSVLCIKNILGVLEEINK